MSEMKQSKSGYRYPHELKLAITRRYLSEKVSFSQLSKEYNINAERLRCFVLSCKEEALELFFQNDLSLTRMKGKGSKSLEKENARLKEELKLLSIKLEGYEHMLSSAGQKYGEDLLKKVVTKQSAILKRSTRK